MTDQESSSSQEPSSPPSTSPRVFKAIIALGVMGYQDDVLEFISLWVSKSEALAQLMASRGMFDGKIQLLPIPEDDAEVQKPS